MSKDRQEPKRLERVLLVVVFSFFAVAIPYCLLNQYGGVGDEISGVVVSVGAQPNDMGPMRQMAKVRTAQGLLVLAPVVAGPMVSVGDPVMLRVYSRNLSGAKAYEIVGTTAGP